jgi:hypothetical protein
MRSENLRAKRTSINIIPIKEIYICRRWISKQRKNIQEVKKLTMCIANDYDHRFLKWCNFYDVWELTEEGRSSFQEGFTIFIVETLLFRERVDESLLEKKKKRRRT